MQPPQKRVPKPQVETTALEAFLLFFLNKQMCTS